MTATVSSARKSMFAPRLETMPRERLEMLQLERLRATVERAYANVPHYRRAFDDAGARPGDLRSLDDLAAFPFVVKAHLRDNYPFGFFATPRTELLRLHASSGTTGKPTVVGYTANDLDVWADLMARSLAAAGAHSGDLVHNAYGYGLFTGGLGAHDGAQRLGATVVPASGGGTERQVALIRDFGATVLCATPSYALNIAEVAEHLGVDLRDAPLRIGVFGAEPWSEALRRELDERLGITAADIYGLSEIMGPGVACECFQARNGFHGWEDHFLFEIVDPETGKRRAFGEVGELVITTLTKEAMPMVRYRTRDVTRLDPEPCACGRTHVRIARITGRSDDMLIVRGVNLYPSQIEAVLVGFPRLAPYYQLVLERVGTMDRLTLEVEVARGVSDEGQTYAQISAATQHHLKSMLGLTCEIVIKAPGEVPRSQGKAVRVRDLRPKAP